MKDYSIKSRLIFFILFTILLSGVVYTLISTSVITSLFKTSNIKDANNIYSSIEKEITTITDKLTQGTRLISNLENIKLSLNMINNYEDKNHYKTLIFDEQKRILLSELKSFSIFSDKIEIYNAKGELVVFIDNHTKGFVYYKDSLPLIKSDKTILNKPELKLNFFKDNLNYVIKNNSLIVEKSIPITNNSKKVGYIKSSLILSKKLFSMFENHTLVIFKNNQFITNSKENIKYKTITSQNGDNLSTDNKYFVFIKKFEGYNFAVLFKKDAILSTLIDLNMFLIIMFLIISIITIIILILLINKTIINPIDSISNAILKIKNGDYSTHIHHKEKNELGEIIESFNEMMHLIDRSDKEKTKNYEEVIFSFVDIIEKRDTYTAGHSQRVANYSKIIAEYMNLPQEDINNLYTAGLLHDIGKVRTPDSILLKPTKLSFLEYTLMKEHVKASYDILKNIEIYKDLAQIIKYHHERYDGHGYPYGIKGDEIPFLSRIMIVADSFDAMTTNRIYKPRKTLEEALKELEEFSGSQFDPEIVKYAKLALKDIKIDKSINQLPTTSLERERFSYFFKDPLTQTFNKDYLDITLTMNYSDKIYSNGFYIKIHNFSKYNDKYGWEKGNQLLLEIAKNIETSLNNNQIFRVEGDDFVVIDNCQDNIELNHLVDSDIITINVTKIEDIFQYKNFEELKHK
jgi:putative nucleotidyltransferase with HDIG domain